MTVASTWASLVAHHDPAVIVVAGTLLVQLVCFWLPALLFFMVDVFRPRVLYAHKIQPNVEVSPSDMRRCLRVALTNQFLLATPLQAVVLLGARAAGLVPLLRVAARLPAPAELVRDLAICSIIKETLFYCSHRLLHTKHLYRRFHKMHHLFPAPVALAAQFSHPVEHFLLDIFPIIAGAHLLHSHIITFWLFVSYTLFSSTINHCGYHIPGKPGIRFHDWHHQFTNGAYGLPSVDWLLGTDGGYRRTYAAKVRRE